MLSFQRLLTEIYTAPVPWEWKPDEAAMINRRYPRGYFVAKFIIASYLYRVEISPNDEASGAYYVDFTLQRNYPGSYPTHTITGTGHAYEVFSTVVDILKDFIETEQPKRIEFAAEEDSRQKLYARIIKRVPQFAPSYVGVRKSRGMFQIKRKISAAFQVKGKNWPVG